MPNRELIVREMNAAEIVLVGDLVQDAGDESRFYAFVQTTHHENGAQSPTNHSLRKVADTLKVEGAEVVFVLVENDREDVLANVKAMLLRSFPELVRNVFPTFADRGVVIWVEPKKILDGDEVSALKNKSEEFLTFLKNRLLAFEITSSQNVPTRTACLTSLRLRAPVTQNEIRDDLIRRGFDIPSDDWLSNMLDKLRKANFLLRQKNGRFALTLFGLEALGTSKNRRSPDVVRALDIARRGG